MQKADEASKRTARSRTPTACLQCQKRKQRCSREQPCRHCSRRYPPVECIYTFEGWVLHHSYMKAINTLLLKESIVWCHFRLRIGYLYPMKHLHLSPPTRKPRRVDFLLLLPVKATRAQYQTMHIIKHLNKIQKEVIWAIYPHLISQARIHLGPSLLIRKSRAVQYPTL